MSAQGPLCECLLLPHRLYPVFHSPDFIRMQDIPEETESRDGEPTASES